MQLNITGTNLKVTPALKSHAEEKFQLIESHFSEVKIVHLILHIENLEHVAEANLHFQGTDVNATARADDMYAAIDSLVDKIKGQLNKQKEKHIDAARHPHD